MTSLARLVLDRMAEEGWSLRDVVRRGGEHGVSLSVATVGRIANGEQRSPKLTTLDALAVALGVSARTLYEAAKVGEDGGPWVPPEESRLLSQEDRAMLDALVRRLAMGVATRD